MWVMLVWRKLSGSSQRFGKHHKELSNPSVFSPPPHVSQTPGLPLGKPIPWDKVPQWWVHIQWESITMEGLKWYMVISLRRMKRCIQHWFLPLFLGILLPNALLPSATTKLYHLCIPGNTQQNTCHTVGIESCFWNGIVMITLLVDKHKRQDADSWSSVLEIAPVLRSPCGTPLFYRLQSFCVLWISGCISGAGTNWN